jgi:hypothetical protein
MIDSVMPPKQLTRDVGDCLSESFSKLYGDIAYNFQIIFSILRMIRSLGEGPFTVHGPLIGFELESSIVHSWNKIQVKQFD